MSRTVWNRFFIGMALITSIALLIWIAGAKVTAQTTLSGDWTASMSSKDNKLQLNLSHGSTRNHRNQMGQSYEFSEFQGLTREQVQNGGPVSFSLVREAGRIDMEGSFQNGKGSGTFRFTGNAGFVSAMKSRGFDFEQAANSDDDRDAQDRLFAAAALNITTALADDLNSAGFGNLKTEDLFKAAIFKINSQFMREMKAS
jgi:hypothetical protein